ncbi:MAG: hypothetical protein H0X51_01765 [Parachlamydiaceae bacterium]|nr:hypothetical protein [Parachlamydiaceae bacterium]
MTSRTGQKPGCCNPITLYTRLDYNAAKRPEKCYQLYKWVSHAVKAVINRILILWMQRYSPKIVADNLEYLTIKHILQLKPSQLAHLRNLEVESNEKRGRATPAGEQLSRLFATCLKTTSLNRVEVHPATAQFLSHLSYSQLDFLRRQQSLGGEVQDNAPIYHQTLTESFLFRDELTSDRFTTQKEKWVKYAPEFFNALSAQAIRRHPTFLVSLFDDLLKQEYSKQLQDIQCTTVYRLREVPNSEKQNIPKLVSTFLGNLQAEHKNNLSLENLTTLRASVGTVKLLQMVPAQRNEFNARYIDKIFSLIWEEGSNSAIDFGNMPATEISALFSRLVTIFPEVWDKESKERFTKYDYKPNFFKKFVNGVFNHFQENKWELADLADVQLQRAILSRFTDKEFKKRVIPSHLILEIPREFDQIQYIYGLSLNKVKEIFALPDTEYNNKLVAACWHEHKSRISLEVFQAMSPDRQKIYGQRLNGTPLLEKVLNLPLNNAENRRLIDLCTNNPWSGVYVREAFSQRREELATILVTDNALYRKLQAILKQT